MKPYVIKAPAGDRTTVVIAHQFYDRQTRRTKTVYAASFNKALDPSRLPAGITLSKSAAAAGLNLDMAHQLAAPWLVEHGTFGQPRRFPTALVEQVRRELRDELTAEFYKGLEMPVPNPLDLLEGVVADAARELVEEARRLGTAGHKLTSQRSQATSLPEEASALDALQARANRIRRDLFGAFEMACKDAWLMVKKAERFGPAPA